MIQPIQPMNAPVDSDRLEAGAHQGNHPAKAASSMKAFIQTCVLPQTGYQFITKARVRKVKKNVRITSHR